MQVGLLYITGGGQDWTLLAGVRLGLMKKMITAQCRKEEPNAQFSNKLYVGGNCCAN